MSDYAALAQRVAAGVSGIRGCLLLSRDGMVLGAHPEGDVERALKSAWLRFAGIGEPDRCTIEFPDQLWAFVRRGGYAAFVLADAGVRPGVLLDLLEQVLMAGEVERVHDRDSFRLPEAPVAPSGKPRTSLHKPERTPAPVPQPAKAADIRIVEPGAFEPSGDEPADVERADIEPAGDEPVTAEASSEDAPDLDPSDPAAVEITTPADAEHPPSEGGDEETEVDRILLAKEFAGLLQVPRDDDEATR